MSAKKWTARHNSLAREQGYRSWEAWKKALEKEKGRAVCGAITRSQVPCLGRPMPNGRCRKHFGNIPVGPAHPKWKTGRYSALFPTLPKRLQESVERAYDDPELIACRKEMAVLTARMEELYSKLDTDESGSAWKAARIALAAYRDAEMAGDEDGKKMAMKALARAVERGFGDYAIWDEVKDLSESLRRLRETELKRLQALQSFVDTKSVIALVQRLLAIVKDHVRDSATLRLILSQVDKEFGRGARNQT